MSLFNQPFVAAVAMVAALTVASPVWAQERGTRDEAKAMTDAAAAHVKKVGVEKAYKDFLNDQAAWRKKDLYVIVIGMDGTVLAHGTNEKLVGKNNMELKDQDGKFFTKSMIESVKPGGNGWSEVFTWPNPMTKKMEKKQNYSVKLAGVDALVSVGYYQ